MIKRFVKSAAGKAVRQSSGLYGKVVRAYSSVGKGQSGNVVKLSRPAGWGVSGDIMLMGEIVRHGGWVPHLYLGNRVLRAVVGGSGATSLVETH